MRNLLFSILTAVLLTAVTLAAAEGIYSLVNGDKPQRSLSYQFLALSGLAGQADKNIAAYKPYFTDIQELGRLIPVIKEYEVDISSTPINTKSDVAAIKTITNGCPAIKPNLRKVASFLHSSAVNPFEPVSVFHDADKKLDPALAEFFERYGGPRVSLSSNAERERVTVPESHADRVVLVAGDSMTFGAMVDGENPS